MYGYSSYDSYFGLNNRNPYFPITPVGYNYGYNTRPNIGVIPGINAPKEHKSKALPIIATIVGLATSALLIFKNKKGIGKLFNKIFKPKNAKAVEQTAKQTTKKGRSIFRIFRKTTKAPAPLADTFQKVTNAAAETFENGAGI